MKIYTVSFFGHRNIDNFRIIEDKLDELVRSLLTEHEYVVFLVGKDGDFDQIVASAVKRASEFIEMITALLLCVCHILFTNQKRTPRCHLRQQGVYVNLS